MKKRIVIAGALLLVFAAASAAPETVEKKMAKKAGKLFEKAMKAFQEKQVDQAIDLLNQVVVLEPGNAMVRHNLGVMLHQQGLVDEAIASFAEAVKLDPGYQHSQKALRQALFEAGRGAANNQEFEKANGYLLKLMDLPRFGEDSEDVLAMARYLIGQNYYQLKQYPQAQEYLELCRATEGLESENLDLYANATYLVAMIHSIKKEYDAANSHFGKYLDLYKTTEKKPEFVAKANYFIAVNLFQKLEEKLKKGEVAGMAEAAAEIIPYLELAIADPIFSEDAHVMLGNCHVYRKEYDLAVQTYERLIAAGPQSAQLENYKAFLGELQKMKQQQERKAKTKR